MEANMVPRRLDRIEHQLAEMHSDLLFIKAFFIQIAEKKDAQRKRKEKEVRAKEREKKDAQAPQMKYPL